MSKSIDNDVRADWESLILDYLEGDLSGTQFDKFRGLLDKPDFQRLLANHVVDQSLLRELTSPEELFKELNTSLQSLGLPLVRSEAGSSGISSSALKRTLVVFFAISAVLLVMATARLSFWTDSSLQAKSDLPRIRSMVGNVTVRGGTASVGTRLVEGEKISTKSMTSIVRLAYDDGTLVVLAGDSSVVCDHQNDQKRITIRQGNISASVAPQPAGKPLLLISDSAVMQVLGTRLAVSADKNTTRLDVTEGKVNFQERALGTDVDVSAGKYAVASLGQALHLAAQTKVPDTWSVNFEEGLPKGWKFGIWEREGLGKGLLGKPSLGAVRAAFRPNDGFYSIFSTNAWSEGLFRIEENTVLHYRVKMERPDWYQVLLLTRDGEFRVSEFQGSYEYQELSSREAAMGMADPLAWRTVHVPVSGFKRSDVRSYPSLETPFGERPVDPPVLGNVVYSVIFSTQDEDRGLVVDDISITVDTP